MSVIAIPRGSPVNLNAWE